MKRAALTALAIAAAIVVGRATVSTPGATHTERVIEHRSVEPRVVQARGLTADEVRDIVHAELAQKPVAEEPVLAPADDSAFARGHAVLDQGLADAKWTDEDRERLRLALPDLQPAQVRQIVRSLYVTINNGTVRVELEGPPV
jgi:hypothetical protein